jgi:predicted PurR-regulated permease PerM
MTPDQILPIALIVVMLVVAVVLVLVGIQLFFLLKETRVMVKSIDELAQSSNQKLGQLINPIRTLGSLATGVAGGVKVFEAFSQWLSKQKKLP